MVNPCQDKMAQITWLSEVAVRLKQTAVCTIKRCSLLASVLVMSAEKQRKNRLMASSLWKGGANKEVRKCGSACMSMEYMKESA